ncbi:MAG: ROK family protein, partial [Pseudomonadota bacterium]
MIRIGVDLGGTKIEAVALGPGNRVLARERTPTPRGDYEGTVAAIAGIVERVEGLADGRAPGIGVGIPGSLDPQKGTVRNANTTALIGRPLAGDLASRLGGRPVVIDNDANCFALAEARAGAAQGYRVVQGFILGTGAGSGLVFDGRAHTGANRIGGEWGHVPLPWPTEQEHPGPTCWCGLQGCLELWVAGPALERDHAASAGLGPDDARPRVPEIVARWQGGDPVATGAIGRHLSRLGRGMAVAVNIVDPDAIVLGGGLSNLEHLYQRLPAALLPHVFTGTFTTPILKNALGDSAGVIGAAW